MNQKREVIVRVKDIVCHNTATIGSDDVYFISTLRPVVEPRSFDLSPDNPIPKHLTAISDVIEEVEDDGKSRVFKNNTAYQGIVPLQTPFNTTNHTEDREDMVVEGCIYLIARDDEKDVDQEPRKLNLTTIALASTILGIVIAIITFPIPFRGTLWPLIFLKGLGVVTLVDLVTVGISYLFNRVIDLIVSPWAGNDDYIMGFRVRIPVAGKTGTEATPRSPYVGKIATQDLPISGRKVVFDGTGSLFSTQHYEVNLEVERKAPFN